MTSVARGSLIVFGSQVIANAGFFVAVLIIARGLGPEGRGTIAFVIVSALVLARLAPLGLAEATLVFVSQRPSARPQLLSNLLLFSLVAAFLVGGVAAVVLAALGSRAPAGIGPGEILVLVLGTTAVAVMDGADQFLIGCGKIAERAAVSAVTPWIYAGLVAALLSLGALTVTGAAAAWATAMIVGAFALALIAGRATVLGRPQRALLGESIAFGIRAWIGHLASFANLRADQILLGLMATPATLGIYAAAVNGSEVLLYFPAAVATMLIPAFARADPHARKEQALRTFRILALTTVASMVLAALLGPLMLPLLFGSRFQGSAEPFLWLLPGALGFAASRVFSGALMASRSSGRYSIAPIAALFTGIALDVVLIPSYGAVGAAAAASTAFLVGGAVALVAYRSRFSFPWSSLVPGRRDLQMLGQLVARVRTDLVPSAVRSQPK